MILRLLYIRSYDNKVLDETYYIYLIFVHTKNTSAPRVFKAGKYFLEQI